MYKRALNDVKMVLRSEQIGLEVGSSRFCVISLTTQNCRGVSHTPSHGRRYTADDGDVFAAIVSFSPTSGRMQYAPTPVRLKSGLDWGMGGLRLRSLQGVCDTHLHLFG